MTLDYTSHPAELVEGGVSIVLPQKAMIADTAPGGGGRKEEGGHH